MGAACPTIGMVAFAKFSLMDPQVLVATALLSAALFAGAVIIALVSRWHRRQENETFTTHDNLASFRVLYERGELNAEEFERIKAKVLGRLKKDAAALATGKDSAPKTTQTKTTDVAVAPPTELPTDKKMNDQTSDL